MAGNVALTGGMLWDHPVVGSEGKRPTCRGPNAPKNSCCKKESPMEPAFPSSKMEKAPHSSTIITVACTGISGSHHELVAWWQIPRVG